MSALSDWIISCLLLGLRIGPVFAFAPPFSLAPVPRLFRLLFGLGLAVSLVSAHPAATSLANASLSAIVIAAVRELMMGTVFVLAFALAFAAIYVAGRTIDIQAGYGLATLIDPTSRAQTPLVGTLFAYAAGAIFFAADGHIDLLRLFGASLDAIPLGMWPTRHSCAGSSRPLRPNSTSTSRNSTSTALRPSHLLHRLLGVFMAVAPVSSAGSATAAFGLDFQSLLRIILTELTYQDPLKPLDNFQFVSQLGQFAQLQQSQSLNDQITQLLASQGAAQATGLIGRTVDLMSGDGTTTSGHVTAVSFSTGQPQLTITTTGGDVIGGLSLANISQVR